MRKGIAGMIPGGSVPGEEKKKPKKKAAKKKGKKKKKELNEDAVEISYSDKAILSLLNLPFDIAAVKTGFQRRIPQEMHEQLATSANACLEEFGAANVGKWIHLAVFVASYGTCGVMWFQEFKKWRLLEQQKFELAQKLAKENKPPIQLHKDQDAGIPDAGNQ